MVRLNQNLLPSFPPSFNNPIYTHRNTEKKVQQAMQTPRMVIEPPAAGRP